MMYPNDIEYEYLIAAMFTCDGDHSTILSVDSNQQETYNDQKVSLRMYSRPR